MRMPGEKDRRRSIWNKNDQEFPKSKTQYTKTHTRRNISTYIKETEINNHPN